MACITKEDYTKMCKKRKQLVYLKLQGFLYAEADKYWDIYDCAEWLIICQWFYAFYKDALNKKVTKYCPTDKQQYAWVSYKWLAQRLGAYGIRNPDTIGRWFTKLSTDAPDAPALLKKWVVFDEDTQHSSVYLCPTEACERLFAVPTSAEDMADYVARIAEESSDETTVQEAVPFVFPDWWGDFANEVDSMYKYANKVFKKDGVTMNKYIIEAVDYINSLLDGSFYDKYGSTLTNKYDLSDITLAKIVDGLRNCWVPNEKGHVADVILPHAVDKKPRKSPLLDTIFGTRFQKEPPKSKPKSFYEADKPENTPNWIWEANQLPSLYPEIQQYDRKFWGFYVNAIEYINDCQKKDDVDRNNWGIWTKLNNGLTNPANNLFMDIFRAAKKADIGLEEIYSLKFGDVHNFLWILTAREMKQNHSIKILPEGNNNEYVYGTGPLNRAKYERRN